MACRILFLFCKKLFFGVARLRPNGVLQETLQRCSRVACGLLTLLSSIAPVAAAPRTETSSAKPNHPNVLFVILDDVGIDQMEAFGYGGITPPNTPNINVIANKGLRFRNTWGMPECSPSRAAFFTGRYPLRNNIYQAIGPNDLANSQVSPYETTVPRIMKRAGYINGLFGKFHLAGPENNPFGHGTPASLGFDYFYGFVGGLPDSIDTTAGGVAAVDTYSCGFVNNTTIGACYLANDQCTDTIPGTTPGRTCMEQGGIFVPSGACSSPAPSLNFDIGNAYYASPVVVNRRDGKVVQFPYSNKRGRMYRTTLEVDAARDWIKERSSDSPWMATVSFSSDHTPLQPPPAKLVSEDIEAATLDCRNPLQQRAMSDLMIEAVDTELGRLLVETGIAKRSKNGRLIYDPKETNTMIVIIGDNGSFGLTVKLPFDATRAKGTAYQTGVWVPLIVSGPLVNSPNRNVEHMVNLVDVYQLFGEMAGVNVHRAVHRTLDARPMLPYLTNPRQDSIRRVNFTQFGQNIQANPYGNGPCVLGTNCSQTPISKSVCEDNGGVWWGPGADDATTAGIPAEGLLNCCQVNQFKVENSQTTVSVLPATQAVRNQRYKIVRNSALDYDSASNSCLTKSTEEFYEIDQGAPLPKLDRSGSELPIDALTSLQQTAYNSLTKDLEAILDSEPACPGDGNLDGVVNKKDLRGWELMVRKTRQNLDGDSSYSSSVFDFDHNGITDRADRATIVENLGKRCS